MTETYMIVLHEKTLQTEILPFKDGIRTLHDHIECDTIDHCGVIDYLNKRNIDMWVDDEGILKNRYPVFVFQNEHGENVGAIVGNIVFEKHDNQGVSFGLTKSECDEVLVWLYNHDCYTAVDDSHMVYMISPEETEEHRKRLEDMKAMFSSMGGDVIEV